MLCGKWCSESTWLERQYGLWGAKPVRQNEQHRLDRKLTWACSEGGCHQPSGSSLGSSARPQITDPAIPQMLPAEQSGTVAEHRLEASNPVKVALGLDQGARVTRVAQSFCM